MDCEIKNARLFRQKYPECVNVRCCQITSLPGMDFDCQKRKSIISELITNTLFCIIKSLGNCRVALHHFSVKSILSRRQGDSIPIQHTLVQLCNMLR